MRKSLSLICVMLMTLSIAWVSRAMADEYTQGRDYQVLPAQVPVRDASKIEVVELFWYGCPHCYHLEPLVSVWHKALPEDVDFWRSPAAFKGTWKTHAQAFYTAEVMGIGEEIHQPLFDALARDRKPLNSESALAKFFSQFGVTEEKFKKAYNSFSVKSKVEQAAARGVSYRVTGVPVLIVNGKYRVEPGLAGSFERMLKIADFLIAKERAAQG